MPGVFVSWQVTQGLLSSLSGPVAGAAAAAGAFFLAGGAAAETETIAKNGQKGRDETVPGARRHVSLQRIAEGKLSPAPGKKPTAQVVWKNFGSSSGGERGGSAGGCHAADLLVHEVERAALDLLVDPAEVLAEDADRR